MSRTIYTESPLKSLWIWLGRLSSFESAKKFLDEEPPTEQLSLAEAEERARSLAFAIRSAREYFHAAPEGNLTEACLSYYYGLLSLLSALIIADPQPPYTLSEIEKATRNGHGLNNLTDDTQQFPKSELIQFIDRGFAPLCNKVLGFGLDDYFHDRRFTNPDDLPDRAKVVSLFELIIRVPELRQSIVEQYNAKNGSLKCAYFRPGLLGRDEHVLSFDEEYNYPELSVELITGVAPEISPGLLKEIAPEERGGLMKTRAFEARIGKDHEDSIPDLYGSPIVGNSVIRPLFGRHPNVLLLHLAILYLLSIFVRYRPNLWRRIMEGDLDSHRHIVSEYLQIAERTLPNLVLNHLYVEYFQFQQLV